MNFTNRSQAKKQTGLSYLGSINSSAKIVKNKKVLNIDTYILYLAPASLSGYNVCPYSTPECRLGCLNTSGRVKMEENTDKKTIQNARIKKTKLFYEENEFFMNWLVAEISANKQLSESKGSKFSVRLNGTSDIDWTIAKVNGKTVFEIFPDVQFYDYTKNPNMIMKQLPKNYHVTLSYSGKNESLCKKYLANGGNVAVVFNVKDVNDFPATWNGFNVVNGDETDYRPADGNGVVVGLKWKNIANKENNETIKNSKFVVQVVTRPEYLKKIA